MKKLILSAVMMMAFVGTSMAKTGEVKDEKFLNLQSKECNKTLNIVKNSTLLEPAYSQCIMAAAAAYGALVGTTGEDEAMEVALLVEAACEEARTC